MSGVLVIAEHRNGVVRDVTLEMLSAGRRFAAERGDEVSLVVLAEDARRVAEPLVASSPRTVCVSGPEFRDFNYEDHQRALVELVGVEKPDVVLLAHSAFGIDLGPSLAVELGIGVVSDVIGWSRIDDGLLVTRGMYGGKLCAERLVTTSSALLLIRQSSFKPELAPVQGTVVDWSPEADPAERQTRFLGLEELPTTGIDITKADVVVAVGRGIKEEKNLASIREFADAIGAVLAGSRPVIDAGWLPKETQVGSSGKTVKPKVYIALGISGAFQHVAGMTGAETIIAVNKDEHAPIFAVAHYGVVDDLLKVIPVLKEKLTAAAS